MNWVKKHKLPAMEVIKLNNQLCNNLDNLWYTLYQSYNSAQDRPINLHLFKEVFFSPVVE